jgi:hypothetical protein
MTTDAISRAGQDEAVVICAKCRYANPAELTRCADCHRHLYIVCHCGERNRRSLPICGKCGRYLHGELDCEHLFTSPQASIPANPAPATTAPPGTRVLCAKCGYANDPEVEQCAICHKQLYVYCHCGEKNLRSRRGCSKCGERLRSRHSHGSEPFLGTSRPRDFAPPEQPPRGDQLAVAVLILALLILVPLLLAALGQSTDWQTARQADWQAGKDVPAEAFYLVPLLTLTVIVGLPALALSFLISSGRRA